MWTKDTLILHDSGYSVVGYVIHLKDRCMPMSTQNNTGVWSFVLSRKGHSASTEQYRDYS